jgi:hypothetical protein
VPEHVDFFAVDITAYPVDAERAPPLADGVHARVARPGDVIEGNLILVAVSLRGADYFNDQYTAHPGPYDPACQCGVCCHLTHEPDPIIVLPNDRPWRPTTRGSPTPWSSSSPPNPCTTGPRRNDAPPCPAPRSRRRCPAPPPTMNAKPSKATAKRSRARRQLCPSHPAREDD